MVENKIIQKIMNIKGDWQSFVSGLIFLAKRCKNAIMVSHEHARLACPFCGGMNTMRIPCNKYKDSLEANIFDRLDCCKCKREFPINLKIEKGKSKTSSGDLAAVKDHILWCRKHLSPEIEKARKEK